MKAFLFLLAVVLIGGCGKEEESKQIVLSGRAFTSDGRPAKGIPVQVVTYVQDWFATKPKIYHTTTDSNGLYALKLDGGFGSERELTARFSDDTLAQVSLTLFAYEIHMPDLHQWEAQPRLEMFPSNSTAGSFRLSWKHAPSSLNIPPGTERWRATAWASYLMNKRSVLDTITEGKGSVEYPAELLSGMNLVSLEITAMQVFEGEPGYSLKWIGGKIGLPNTLKSYQTEMNCFAQAGDENKMGETSILTDNEAVGMSTVISAEWIACEFFAPTTISTLAWYGADLRRRVDEREVEPEVNVHLFDSEVRPSFGFWGEPASSQTSAFGYVTLPEPRVVRWFALVPADSGVQFQYLKEVRAW